ncbi:MAG: signal peptidase I [Chloroflexi bacterium]|nr:signal peptidase I [Chloroflexota bacterium]
MKKLQHGTARWNWAIRPLRGLYHVVAFLLASRVEVAGWSMHPALAPGEYVLFDRLAYWSRNPERGDVVLARDPRPGNRSIIKRVVGVPGDTIRVTQGGVLVNGTPAPEQNASGQDHLTSFQESEWLLGREEYFLLGDARERSTDSRSFGPVPRKAIKARAWLVYWPLKRWRTVD